VVDRLETLDTAAADAGGITVEEDNSEEVVPIAPDATDIEMVALVDDTALPVKKKNL